MHHGAKFFSNFQEKDREKEKERKKERIGRAEGCITGRFVSFAALQLLEEQIAS